MQGINHITKTELTSLPDSSTAAGSSSRDILAKKVRPSSACFSDTNKQNTDNKWRIRIRFDFTGLKDN